MKPQSEKTLQEAIEKLLLWKGVTPIRSRMDRATTNSIGTPDFLFAVRGQACAWECKLPGKQPTLSQFVMLERLEHDGWNISIIHSIDEAIAELEALQKEPAHRMRDWSPAARPSSCYALPRRTKVKVMARASLWLKTRKVTSPSLPHSASPTLQKLHG